MSPPFIPGLVSITFRQLDPKQIVDLVNKAGLKAIEWGGDVHVPTGDTGRAREVGERTRDAGLQVAAYGSYYRLGLSESKGLSFPSVLDTAVALGAPTIRIWAGEKGSEETTPAQREALLADAARVATLAQAQGLTVSLEYHENTLTDTRFSVQQCLREMEHPGLEFLWQPTNGEPEDLCILRLQDVLAKVRHVHVFHWWPNKERQPLAEGETRWRRYLEILQTAGRPMPCLLEFARDDRPEQFLEDAATLRRWLNQG